MKCDYTWSTSGSKLCPYEAAYSVYLRGMYYAHACEVCKEIILASSISVNSSIVTFLYEGGL